MTHTATPYGTVRKDGLTIYDLSRVTDTQVCDAIQKDCLTHERWERIKSLTYAISSLAICYILWDPIVLFYTSKYFFVGTVATVAALYKYSNLNVIFDYILHPFIAVYTHIQRADHYMIQGKEAFQKRLTLIPQQEQ
jgi:hypothetical protein